MLKKSRIYLEEHVYSVENESLTLKVYVEHVPKKQEESGKHMFGKKKVKLPEFVPLDNDLPIFEDVATEKKIRYRDLIDYYSR